MEKNLKRVTREQAEKLNKLGFDYETDFAYYKDEAHVGLLAVGAIMRTNNPFYFAPTVDLALQYLEEKWGFYYEIYKGEGSDARFGFKGNNSRFKKEHKTYFGFTSTASYETRKEAKSHLLTEALDFYLEALNKEEEAEKIWSDYVLRTEALDFYLEALKKKKEAEKIWSDFVTDTLKGDSTPQVKTVLEELETDKKDTLATKIEAIEKEIDSIKKLL